MSCQRSGAGAGRGTATGSTAAGCGVGGSVAAAKRATVGGSAAAAFRRRVFASAARGSAAGRTARGVLVQRPRRRDSAPRRAVGSAAGATARRSHRGGGSGRGGWFGMGRRKCGSRMGEAQRTEADGDGGDGASRTSATARHTHAFDPTPQASSQAPPAIASPIGPRGASSASPARTRSPGAPA